MASQEKPCTVRLQINSMAVEITDSFTIGDPGGSEPVEQRLGGAIGQSLCALRSQISFDPQAVLKHASDWVHVMAVRGAQELAEEADNPTATVAR